MAMTGVRIGLPGVPDGPDADLDNIEGEVEGRPGKMDEGSPAKRSRAVESTPQNVLTMESIRQLLAEQSVSLLQAQQV